MDTVALRFFLEVARTGSIAAASERVHVAGSAISRRISALEFQLGVPLFERQPRGMTLTLEGELLADHVRRSILEEDRVVSDIKGLGARTVGTILMATSEGLAAHFVPEIVHAYRQRSPDIRFVVRSQSPEGIVWEVREGLVDVGVAFAAGRDTNIEVMHRVSVPTFALVAPDHALAGAGALSLKDIQAFPVATSKASTLRRLLELRSTFEGVKLDIVYECNSSAGLFAFAAQGNAVAFATEIAARSWLRRGELIEVPLEDRASFDRTIEIQVMKGRALPAYVLDWIEHVRLALGGAADVRDTASSTALDGKKLARRTPRLVQ